MFQIFLRRVMDIGHCDLVSRDKWVHARKILDIVTGQSELARHVVAGLGLDYLESQFSRLFFSRNYIFLSQQIDRNSILLFFFTSELGKWQPWLVRSFVPRS